MTEGLSSTFASFGDLVIRLVPEFTPAAAMQITKTIVTEHEAGAAISIGSRLVELGLHSARRGQSYQ
jgi:hypothetical protein